MLHMLGSKRKWKKKKHKNPQNKTFKKICQGLAAPFTLVCVHLFSPMVVNFVSFLFLSLGYSGHQGLCAKPDEMCTYGQSPFSLQEIILTEASVL